MGGEGVSCSGERLCPFTPEHDGEELSSPSPNLLNKKCRGLSTAPVVVPSMRQGGERREREEGPAGQGSSRGIFSPLPKVGKGA